MKKRRQLLIRESIYEFNEYRIAMEDILDSCLELYPKGEYVELGVFLGFLRAVGMVHQSHHWQTSGREFYADHLLFERVYEEIPTEIDKLAEKVVGIANASLTNYFAQVAHIKAFLDGVSKQENLVTESLRAELMFIIVGEVIMDRLECQKILTRGLEQLLGSILDKHEENSYLLNQRYT